MGILFGRKRGRALSGVVSATAIAAALAGLTAGTAAADSPAGGQITPKPVAASANAPQFPLFAVNRDGDVYNYQPNGRGGFEDRETYGFFGSPRVSDTATVDHDRNGEMDG
ncbi:hypothetical protein [Streptomyces sp. NPDC021096]|uniref:hypothetical protein n=1 Tax=Streptomyces sp. NPDC021096 TaxID=3154792 RepID=UPI0033C8BB5B